MFRPIDTNFQFDGPEGALLMALVVVFTFMAIGGLIYIIVNKLKGYDLPSYTFLDGGWKGRKLSLPFLYIVFLFLPTIAVDAWLYASMSNWPDARKVDELYYFEIQHIKDRIGVDQSVFFDNRGRFIYADCYGNPEGKVARKRVFRGRSYGISWEEMQFDLVDKGVKP